MSVVKIIAMVSIAAASVAACSPNSNHSAPDVSLQDAAEIVSRYGRRVTSSDPVIVQQAAEEIFGRRIRQQELLDVVAETLAQNYAKKPNEDLHVYAMSWLCKALGASDNGRYKQLLAQVAKDAQAEQLHGYCERWESKLPAGVPVYQVGTVDLSKYHE